MRSDSDDALILLSCPQQLDLKVDVRPGSLAFICDAVSDQRLIPVVKINLKVLIVTVTTAPRSAGLLSLLTEERSDKGSEVKRIEWAFLFFKLTQLNCHLAPDETLNVT